MRRLALLSCILAACGTEPTLHKADSTTDATLQLADLPIRVTKIQAGSFAQEIDHPYQPAASLGTFAQRYWYTTEFADNENSPVIIYLCGEAACAPGYAQFMSDTAKVLHASIVVLEHRYYGTSLPYPDLTLEHMKYLTIHNALEDTATFQRWAMASLPLKGKWIAAGGSYPGMLAAFYRLKHPELCAGAWASSAPVNMQTSFWGYDAIAAKALGPVCTLLVRQVVDIAGRAYDDEAKRAELIRALGYDGWVPADKKQLQEVFTWTTAGAAQYGDTKPLCAALQQYATDPMTGFLLYMNPPLVADDAPTGTTGSTTAEPHVAWAPARRPAPADEVDFKGSEWYYQTCTEVGFFQVYNPDRSASIMPDSETEAAALADCQRWVGTTPNTALARERYYNPIARGEASNLFFGNSSEDPWSALSFIDQASAPSGVTTYLVQGGSHCEDQTYLTRSSLLGVFEAHKRFYDLAVQWLAQGEPASTPANAR